MEKLPTQQESQALNPTTVNGWNLLSLSENLLAGLKDGALRPVEGVIQLAKSNESSQATAPTESVDGNSHGMAYNIGSMVGQAFDFTVLDLAAKRIPGLAVIGKSGSAIAAGGALGFLSANDVGHNAMRDRLLGAAMGAGTMGVMEGTSTIFSRAGLAGSVKRTIANNVLSGLVTGAASTQIGAKLETGHWASLGQTAESAFSWGAVGGVLGGISARLGRVAPADSAAASTARAPEAVTARSSEISSQSQPVEANVSAASVLQTLHPELPANHAQLLSAVIDKTVAESAENGAHVKATDLVGQRFNTAAYTDAYQTLERSSDRWVVVGSPKEQWLSQMAFRLTRTLGSDWSAWLEAQPNLKNTMPGMGEHDLGRIGSQASALPLQLVDHTPGLKDLLVRNPQLSTESLSQISSHLQANPTEGKWLLSQGDQSVQTVAKVWNDLPELPAPIALAFADHPPLERLAAKAAWSRVSPTLSEAQRLQASAETFEASKLPAFSQAFDDIMAGGKAAVMNDANVVKLTAAEVYPHLSAQETDKLARAASMAAAHRSTGLTASELLTHGFDADAFRDAVTRLEGNQKVVTIDSRSWFDKDRVGFQLANTFGKDWQQWLEPHIDADGKPLDARQFSDLRFPAYATTDLAPLKEFLLRSPDLKLSEVNSLLSRLDYSDKQSYDALFQRPDSEIRNALTAWNIEPRLPIPLAIEYGGKRTVELAAATVAFREANGLKPAHIVSGIEVVTEPISLDQLPIERPEPKVDTALDIMPADSVAFDNVRGRYEDVLARGKYAVLEQAQSLKAAIQVFHPKLSPAEADYLESAARNAEDRHPDTMSLVGANVKAGTFSRVLRKLTGSGDTLPDNLSWQPASALATTNIFGRDAEQWLALQRRNGADYHDATQWLPLYAPKEASGLGRFLLKNSERNERDLALVARRWSKLPDDMRELNFTKLVQSLRDQTYKNAKSPALAAEAARWDVSEDDYYKHEARYLASLKTPSSFPTDKVWQSGGLQGHFLPRSDERGLFLGEYTNCCQHPANAGAACAWFGQESARSGFFVVTDKTGNIGAQSWAWLADHGGLVFDSLESKGLGGRAKATADIYQKAANDLSKQFGTVTLGKGTQKLNLSAWQDAGSDTKPLPKAYGQRYTDAHQQVLLAKGGEGSDNQVLASGTTRDAKDFVFDPYAPERAAERNHAAAPQAVPGEPVDNLISRPLVRVPKTAADVQAAENIAETLYPDGYRYVSEGDTMLVLDLPGKGPVGYAALDLDGHEINDLAVLPQYRKYSTVLMRGLQQFIKEYDSRPGDVWNATLRESTTDRLLNFYNRQGNIKILSRQPGESMNGEPMFDVSFTVN